jgi:hypothetical protein
VALLPVDAAQPLYSSNIEFHDPLVGLPYVLRVPGPVLAMDDVLKIKAAYLSL